MGTIEQVFHITDLKGLFELLQFLGVNETHPIPLHKILFTLKRKDFLATIIVELNPDCPQYAAECLIQERDSKGLRRLHFFCEPYNPEELFSGTLTSKKYGGYCDVRPGTATIAAAVITEHTVMHNKSDGYAFLCCRAHETISMPTPSGAPVELTVSGFHYLEKNGRETMCAQAALCGVARYWHEKTGIFTAKTSIEINKLAGLADSEQSDADDRGLSPGRLTVFSSRRAFLT